MRNLPRQAHLITLPSSEIADVIKGYLSANIGSVAKRYLREMLDRLEHNRLGLCNPPGLVLSLEEAVNMFDELHEFTIARSLIVALIRDIAKIKHPNAQNFSNNAGLIFEAFSNIKPFPKTIH